MSGANFFNKLTDEWPAKILSIVLACFLYIFQHTEGITSANFDIQLSSIENNELISSSDIPKKVRITVRGFKNDLNSITENDLKASVNFSRYNKPGTYRVPVEIKRSENYKDMNALDITRITPSELNVAFDKRAGKYFIVNPVIKGEVSPGFELVYYTVSPRQIYIEGPAGIIDEISTVYTEPIDIIGRESSFSINVRVVDIDSLSSLKNDTVRFSATIKYIELVRFYDDVPVNIINLPEELVISPSEIKGAVKVQGNKEYIEKYSPEKSMSINCSGINSPGTYNIPVSIDIPGEIELLSYEPQTAAFTIEKAGQ